MIFDANEIVAAKQAQNWANLVGFLVSLLINRKVMGVLVRASRAAAVSMLPAAGPL
jgi:hypothetical protein